MSWIGIAVLLFPVLLFITAPYGRHSKSDWGKMIDNRMGWFIMEMPTLLVFVLLVVLYGDLSNFLLITASFLWVVHYSHRVFMYPLRLRTKGKKMPLVIMSMAVLFNIMNGFLNGYWLSHYICDYSTDFFYNIRHLIGIAIFITGFAINKYHDKILIELRKTSKNGYKIPYGGLFKYISCPNFFGEIIEWGGFAILVWGLAPLSFFIWTLINLFPRALDHHKWYKSHFEDYPDKRKAIIPFVI